MPPLHVISGPTPRRCDQPQVRPQHLGDHTRPDARRIRKDCENSVRTVRADNNLLKSKMFPRAIADALRTLVFSDFKWIRITEFKRYNPAPNYFSAQKVEATRAALLSPPQISKEIRLSGPRTRNRAGRCGWQVGLMSA